MCRGRSRERKRRGCLAFSAAERAELLHIYFGHIAVHLLPLISRWDKPKRRLIPRRGRDGRAGEAGLSLGHAAHARSGAAGARSLRIAARRARGARMRRGENPHPAHRYSAATISLSRTRLACGWRWRVLQAGRLIEKKGLRTTLRAFAALRRHNTRTRDFTIAGEGPLLGRLAGNGACVGHRRARRVHRLRFAAATARAVLRLAHLPAPERNGTRMETRKAFRTRCSKRWQAGCRFSRRHMAEFRKRSRMASAACSWRNAMQMPSRNGCSNSRPSHTRLTGIAQRRRASRGREIRAAGAGAEARGLLLRSYAALGFPDPSERSCSNSVGDARERQDAPRHSSATPRRCCGRSPRRRGDASRSRPTHCRNGPRRTSQNGRADRPRHCPPTHGSRQSNASPATCPGTKLVSISKTSLCSATTRR